MDSAALCTGTRLINACSRLPHTHRAPASATHSLPSTLRLSATFGLATSTSGSSLMGKSESKMRITTAAASEGGAAETVSSVQGSVPSKEELRKRLSKEQYYVTQEKGTERAFSGKYWNEKRRGVYQCVCCNTPLFDSATKFDSGTGWPSYYDKVGNNVKEHKDTTIPFMPRVEVVCKTCDAHLGHVFNDGPRPTGLRYCINSASIQLDADAKPSN